MKRALLVLSIVIIFLGALRIPAYADPYPSDPPVETARSNALRAVYFPFLAVGHGIVLIVKYGVFYPLYYVFKPVYDTIYESSEDPAEMSRSRTGSGS